MRLAVDITLPEHIWEPIGEGSFDELDPLSRLLATVVINGTYFHFTAFEVARYDEDDNRVEDGEFQRAVLQDMGNWDDYLAQLHVAFGCDGHLETVSLFGRDYVIFAEPFS